MIRNSRFVAAIGLVVALGVSGLAFADGASENTSEVLGSITPTKLSPTEPKAVDYYSGVTTNTTHTVPGQQNAEQVTLWYPSGVYFNFKNAEPCTAPLNGTTTDQAVAACPPKSIIGTGTAHANLGQGPDQVSDTQVTVIVTDIKNAGNVKTKNGKAKSKKPKSGTGTLALHAYTPELGAANTQVVVAAIEPKSAGAPKGYGPSLVVKDAPDLAGDAFMLTKFDATIKKDKKAVYATCPKAKGKSAKSTTMNWHGIWIYDDGSKDEADLSTKCTPKGK